MVRGLVVGIGSAAIVVVGLTGCSGKSSKETAAASGYTSEASSAVTASSGSATVAAGAGTATVTIDGQRQDIQGQVACTTAMGNLSIAVGEQATGVAVVMAPDASKVTSVGLGNVNGVVMGYQDGAPGGQATAAKDGKTYTITGTATGVDMANPMAPISKPFEIKVTCP